MTEKNTSEKRKISESQIIERINKDFKEKLVYPIPADQPLATHTQKEMKEIGCLAWYFLPKFEADATKEESLIDDYSSVIGSRHSIRKLLNHEEWELVPESKDDKSGMGWMLIEIKK